MQKVIPIFYSTYGRYINRFRAIPFYIDCLKPVERRLLLTLFQIARSNRVKSAKVIGHCMGSYHPHGDLSMYGSLVQLVHQGLAHPRGNWGGISYPEDSTPGAYRYTEVKSEKWVNDFAFKYINYVPWEALELDEEPIYLPCPLPLGLIGSEVITGISFHRTIIPRYRKEDLAKRLVWILENSREPKDLGPEIIPFARNCGLFPVEEDSYYQLLKTGKASIIYSPHGEIKGKEILIRGQAPNSSYKPLIKAATPTKGSSGPVLNVTISDHGGDKNKRFHSIEIGVKPKRKTDLNQLAQLMWSKYLQKKINFEIIVCDHDGMVHPTGIDNLLINCYQFWKQAVLKKKIADHQKCNDKAFDGQVIRIIRKIFEQTKSVSLGVLLDEFNKKYSGRPELTNEFDTFDLEKGWIKYQRTITINDIKRIASARSIRSLIDVEFDINQLYIDVQTQMTPINNNDNDCYNEVKTYC